VRSIVKTSPQRAFIAVLKACRAEAGLKQSELAERCKRSQGWVSKIERDASDVKLADLELLAKGLGIPLRTLVERWLDWMESGR
jgi:transcriptional regulator with XRE-family HTH domain